MLNRRNFCSILPAASLPTVLLRAVDQPHQRTTDVKSTGIKTVKIIDWDSRNCALPLSEGKPATFLRCNCRNYASIDFRKRFISSQQKWWYYLDVQVKLADTVYSVNNYGLRDRRLRFMSEPFVKLNHLDHTTGEYVDVGIM